MKPGQETTNPRVYTLASTKFFFFFYCLLISILSFPFLQHEPKPNSQKSLAIMNQRERERTVPPFNQSIPKTFTQYIQKPVLKTPPYHLQS